LYTYTVLGAGRQGTAAAYDMARWGQASRVVLADFDLEAAHRAASRLEKLTGKDIFHPVQVDVRDPTAVERAFTGAQSALSAVPYYYNLDITKVAIKTKTNLCDLGGNTDIAKAQHQYNSLAKEAGISIIPNCGQVPGMGTSLCVYAIELLDEAIDVFMWDGGIPQKPRPPFNYLLTFNIAGLTNEYAEPAIFLRDWKIQQLETMSELESIQFPEPIGILEAFVAGGGTDTMPWTYEGRLRTLQNKTLRWPGNYAQLRAFYDLGLWDLQPAQIGGDQEIIPREVFHTLFEPKVTFPEDQDMVIIRVIALGKKDGSPAKASVEVIDYYDDSTGFTAMERGTGWSAAVVSEMMARGETIRGSGGVERMVPAKAYVQSLRLRDIKVTESLNFL